MGEIENEIYHERLLSLLHKKLSALLNKCRVTENHPFKEALLNLLKHAPTKEAADIVEETLGLIANVHTNQRIAYLMNEAFTLFAIRKYSEAIMVYKMVLKLDPLYAEAYTKKSMAHLFLNQFADSFSCLDAALIHDPDHLGAPFRKSDILLRKAKNVH